MKLGPLVCLVCTALIFPCVQAASAQYLGTLTATNLFSNDPSTLDALSVAGFGNYSHAQPSTVSWTSGTTNLVVNWTRIDGKSYGFVPANPQAGLAFVQGTWDSDEATFENATMAAAPMSPDARILILGSFTLIGDEASMRAGVDHSDANWSLGLFSNPMSLSGPTTPIPKYQYAPPGGTPIIAIDGTASAATTGNVSAYLWGFELTVQSATGAKTFQSGPWEDNATPSGGGPARASQDRHYQLLRVTVNAQTVLRQMAGSISWATPHATTASNGSFLLRAASGLLEDHTTAYPVNAQDVTLHGLTEITLEVDPSRTALKAHVATANPPEGILSATKTIPTRSGPSWLVVPLVALLAVLIVGAYVWWRREEPLRSFLGADRVATLVKSNPEKAQRKIQGHLRRHPDDTDYIVLHAETYLELGRNRELLKEFATHLGRGGRQMPVLAFIMAKASARLKRAARTLSLVTQACLDPQVRDLVANDPELSPFLHQLQRPGPRPESGYIAYA
jgi:hypothetical protein